MHVSKIKVAIIDRGAHSVTGGDLMQNSITELRIRVERNFRPPRPGNTFTAVLNTQAITGTGCGVPPNSKPASPCTGVTQYSGACPSVGRTGNPESDNQFVSSVKDDF